MVLEVLRAFLVEQPLLFHAIVILISLGLLVKASALTISGISGYAKKLGMSDYIVGLFVVALTASVPEFLAALSGIALESSEVVFGTIFGSNLIGITLALGIIAIVGKKTKVDEKIFEKTKWDLVALMALPFVLLLDGTLTRLDGVLLIVAFAVYLYYLWKREGETGKLKKKVSIREIYKDSAIFLGALLVVFIASFFLVQSSLQIATLMGIPPLIVILVIVGIGSQVPDLSLALHAIRGGHEAVAIGDLLGSMITKSLLFFGIFALITDLSFDFGNTIFTGTFTLLTALLVFYFIKKKELTRWEGWLLVGLYLVFMAVEIMVF